MKHLSVVIVIHAAVAVNLHGDQIADRIDERSGPDITSLHSTRKPDPVARYDTLDDNQIRAVAHETALTWTKVKAVATSDPISITAPVQRTPFRYAERSWRRDVDDVVRGSAKSDFRLRGLPCRDLSSRDSLRLLSPLSRADVLRCSFPLRALV